MISVIYARKAIANKMLKQQKLPTIGYNRTLFMFIGTSLIPIKVKYQDKTLSIWF